MRIASILFLASASGLGALSVTRNASALGPVDVDVAAKVGGGTSPIAGLPNPLGFGVGARAGASLAGFYAGISFMYYVGESEGVSTDGGGPGPTPEKYFLKSILYGIEVGYDLALALITLRPQLGVGSFTLIPSDSNDIFGQPNSTVYVYLEPGVTGLLSFGQWIVGADANALFLPGWSSAHPAFTAHGQVGIKF
jgi:hypothetical protein